MKIVTLIENTSCRDDLHSEHGLSLYIEANGHKILFDTGASGAFAENARKLGVDLNGVDIVILSHGHDDHSGGMLQFFKENDHAPVYLRQEAAEPHYNAAGTFIGLESELLHSERLQFAADEQCIGAGLTLYSCNDRERMIPVDTSGLTVLRKDRLAPDDFSHEQYLLIEEKGKRVLISGCSHKGIRNIANWFAPDVLVGGFHFFRQEPDGPVVSDAAKALLEYPTVYYTGHCTGLAQYGAMKKRMADRLFYLSTGSVIEL